MGLVYFGMEWKTEQKQKMKQDWRQLSRWAEKWGLSCTRAAEVLSCGINTADVLRALNVIILFSGVNFNIYISHLPWLLLPEMRTTPLKIPDLFSYLIHFLQLWSKTTFKIQRTSLRVRYTASRRLYWCDKMNFHSVLLLPYFYLPLSYLFAYQTRLGLNITVCFQLLFFRSWQMSIH